MSETAFPHLPEHARLYIFGASRPFAPEDRPVLERELDAFVGVWKAHGAPVAGAWDIAHERFLRVAVDESQTALSGCSIDSLTRTIKGLEAALGVSLLEGGVVYYRAAEGLSRVTRDEFRRLAEAGQVTTATPVFDNTLTSLRAPRRSLGGSRGSLARARISPVSGFTHPPDPAAPVSHPVQS